MVTAKEFDFVTIIYAFTYGHVPQQKFKLTEKKLHQPFVNRKLSWNSTKRYAFEMAQLLHKDLVKMV